MSAPALRRLRRYLIPLVLSPLLLGAAGGGGVAPKPIVSPLSDPSFFPIAVWLQNPSYASEYAKAGINLYIGLWEGPTENQLAALSRAGMRVICAQNATGLKHAKGSTIVGWMHDDEPDNAQPKAGGGYGPPVNPERIKALYHQLKAKDPSRPVYLNLGQGVAWHGWIGRGVDTGTTHNYPKYAEGADILSFDIYPANTKDKAVRNKLAYVAKGVMNLRKWSDDAKPVWCWIETTRISDESPSGPTPEQVRSEVWMAIVHGAKGVGYFCHSWTPSSDDAALLHDPVMLAAVASINAEVQSLAPVLNGPTIAEAGVLVVCDDPTSSIDIMVKRVRDATYVFAVSMTGAVTTGTFATTPRAGASADEVEVLGEGRKLKLRDGAFTDVFQPYAAHIYQISG